MGFSVGQHRKEIPTRGEKAITNSIFYYQVSVECHGDGKRASWCHDDGSFFNGKDPKNR